MDVLYLLDVSGKLDNATLAAGLKKCIGRADEVARIADQQKLSCAAREQACATPNGFLGAGLLGKKPCASLALADAEDAVITR